MIDRGSSQRGDDRGASRDACSSFGPASDPVDLLGRSSQESKQSGATLAEFAVVLPLLVMLIVGVVEFGWLFAQYLDVRHGAREGVRLAVVNHPEGSDPPVMIRTQANTQALLAETCSRMNIAFQPAGTYSGTGGEGDPVTVTVSSPAETLTGLIDWALPPSLSLTSTAMLHAEQEATWDNTDLTMYPGGQPCP